MLWALLPTPPLSYIIILSLVKLLDSMAVKMIPWHSQLILSSQRRFTYMYIYKYMYRNMSLTVQPRTTHFSFLISIFVRGGYWINAVLPNWGLVTYLHATPSLRETRNELEERCWINCLFLGRSDCTWERLLGFLLPLIGLYHHFAATFPYTDSNTIQVN